MRKATFAKLTLTAVVGLGGILGQATMASAGGPGPQQGSIKVAPTTSTTMKPLPADPVDYCDLHLCLPADEVEPAPPKSCGIIDCLPAEEVGPKGPTGPKDTGPAPQSEDCTPGTACTDPDCTPIPGAADPCPDPDCPLGIPTSECPGNDCDDQPIPGPRSNACPEPCDEDSGPGPQRSVDCPEPCDDGPVVAAISAQDFERYPCEDPCWDRPDGDDDPEGPGPQRSQIDDCDDPCEEVGHAVRHEERPGGDDPCGGTTDSGTDGTTTTDGGPGGRLPKTGVEIMTLAGLGAGGVGIGAALKRLGRKPKEQ